MSNIISQSCRLTDVILSSGALRGQQMEGAVVLADDIKSPAIEKLELMRKWSINTYKVSDSCHSDYDGFCVH